MPTNLPPDYFEVEKQYREASSPEEKIECLEEMLSIVPKHKGTDHLRADLRRRLSKLRETSPGGKRTGKRASAFHIDKEGAGQVVLVGAPNVGKSALVAALTHATPDVTPQPLTTWTPMPGMMPIEDIQVQLIDTPSLNREYMEPELINLIRRADLVLLVVDLQAHPFEQIAESVAILQEHQVIPSHLRDQVDEQRRCTFVPILVLVNKCDDESLDEDMAMFRELLEGDWSLLPISATTGRNSDALKQSIFQLLDIVRVYSKPPGEEPDLGAPYVVKRGTTIEELAAKVHKDFVENLKAARVWGSSVEYDGQLVGRDHVLQDGDIVELRI